MFRACGKSTARLAAVLLLGVLAAAGCGRKESDPTVVSLDGRAVKLSELEAAYDRIHGQNHWRNDSFEDRKQFAELVAKKEMLVRHARETVGGKLPPRQQMIRDRWLEKQIHGIFWPKVRAGIEIPAAHIDSLAREMTHERHLRHVLCRTEAMAQEILAKVRAGGDFLEIGREYAYQNLQSGDALYIDVGWVSRPQLVPQIAAVLFDELTTEGQVGGPVGIAGYGWHVVQLGGLNVRDAAEARPDAEKLADVLYRSRMMQRLIGGLQQQYAFQILPDGLAPLVTHFNAMHDSLNVLRSQGTLADFQTLAPPLWRFSAAERAIPLVRWSGGTFTVEDYVRTLWHVDLDYWPSTGDAERLKAQVDRRLVRWMLIAEAEKRGAMKDPEIVQTLTNKEDELFLDAYYDRTLAIYRENVSDADVQRHWQAHEQEYQTPDLVGYGYIRFPGDLRDLAQQTHAQVRAGTPWQEAAEAAHKLDERVDFEIALEPTSSGSYPQITTAALSFAPQADGSPTITEPLAVGSEWVILRVLSRQRPQVLPFADAAPRVRRDLQMRVLEDSLTATLGGLERRYHLRIDEKPLR